MSTPLDIGGQFRFNADWPLSKVWNGEEFLPNRPVFSFQELPDHTTVGSR